MNERKIIDRKYLCDLAKEVGLTTLDLEALGENHHWEIVVEGNLLERMIETQRQFERLAVIGDEEYRGFYIEMPRPTSEEHPLNELKGIRKVYACIHPNNHPYFPWESIYAKNKNSNLPNYG